MRVKTAPSSQEHLHDFLPITEPLVHELAEEFICRNNKTTIEDNIG